MPLTEATSATTYLSPIGPLFLRATERGLAGLLFETSRHHHPPEVVGEGSVGARDVLAQARAELDEYFSHRRTAFDVPLDLDGTEFQLRVWRALRDIPYGATQSYGALAARVADRGAARAVGAANGSNPVAIIVPCHRVVGARGELTGFGGGLERKRWLLRHETTSLAPPFE
jgi:methylated-DNA-[protein]-cysteine S-methyltransferase